MPEKDTSHAITASKVSQRVRSGERELNILEAIDLRIERGDSVAIVGPSGSGKTTLLGLLAGLDVPTTGTIELLEHEITAMNEEQRARLRRGRVGFVFQSFHLVPTLTALENVMLPLELARATDAGSQAKQLLTEVGLGQRLGHYPSQLSGGERQRTAIARAFAITPEVLFADEPTGNLDAAAGKQVADLLFTLNSSHRTTLVLATHDQRLAERCARRVELAEGRLQ